MTRWCSICDKRGHITSECWYKPNYIKEISREDGKLKKKYTLPSLQKSGKTTIKSKHDKDERSRSRSSSPPPRQMQSVKTMCATCFSFELVSFDGHWCKYQKVNMITLVTFLRGLTSRKMRPFIAPTRGHRVAIKTLLSLLNQSSEL